MTVRKIVFEKLAMH